MVLGGIVLAIAFLLTLGVGAEIRGMERTAVAEQGDLVFPFQVWRELRVLVEKEVRSVTVNSTSAEEFTTIPLSQISTRFESALDVYNLNGRVSLYAEGEADLHDGLVYDAWSHDGGFEFTEPYFGSDDGILQSSPCPSAIADRDDCIIGVYLRFEVTEIGYDLSEPILFSLR